MIDELASTGGTETQLRLLLRSFDRDKVVPRLLLLRGDSPKPGEIGDCDVETWGVHRLRGWKGLSAPPRLVRSARSDGIDLLCPFFADASWIACAAQLLGGPPFLFNTRDVGVGVEPPAIVRTAQRAAASRAAAWVANSEAAGEYAASRAWRSRPVYVVPNAVDTRRFFPPTAEQRAAARRALGYDEDSQVIGCVSNLRPIKGVDDLVRAFATVGATLPKAQLVIVGEGEQRPELERLACDLRVRERVRFLGSRTDVDRIVRAFDLAVLPSHGEGLSNSLLEFMAAGIPAIATDVGGNREALGGGELGMLAPPHSPDALAALVRGALRHPHARREVAGRALRSIEARLAPERVADRWLEVFRAVLGVTGSE